MGELSVSPPLVIDSDLAAILSPSQVRCFMDCQVRWWFKYGLKYPDPKTGKMALGRAVHGALAQNFAQKLDTYEDLPVPGVRAIFRDSWATEREQTEFRDDEDPSELAACGEALVSKYMEQQAPLIQPAAVEMRVEGQIGGIRVQGWIDLIDVDGQIVDIKTAARRPSGVDVDHRFQIATYTQLAPGASGRARVDTLVRTKTPALVTQSFTVTDGDLLAIHKLYPLAQRSMKAEIYMPNRLSMACSRRNCCYWRQCERELGGEVPET
jgi:hypothetical protein